MNTRLSDKQPQNSSNAPIVTAPIDSSNNTTSVSSTALMAPPSSSSLSSFPILAPSSVYQKLTLPENSSHAAKPHRVLLSESSSESAPLVRQRFFKLNESSDSYYYYSSSNSELDVESSTVQDIRGNVPVKSRSKAMNDPILKKVSQSGSGSGSESESDSEDEKQKQRPQRSFK